MIRWIVLALTFLAAAPVWPQAAVRSFQLTDVTPRSFRVLWLADQEGTATVRLFQAPGCVDEIFTATIEPYPTIGQNPAVVAAAQARGIMIVEVSDLQPDTEYCVRTVTTATLTGLTTEAPEDPLLVRTERQTTRGRPSGPDLQAFSNDLVKLAITTTAPDAQTEGVLVVLRATGASSPLTAWVGDGIDDDADAGTDTDLVLFDLNNLYASDGESLDLSGDGSEDLSAMVFGSPEGFVEAIARLLPADGGLAQVVAPSTCRDFPQTVCVGRLGDSDGDGMLTTSDADAIESHVVGLIPVLACMVCADVTGDLDADMRDALAVGQTAVGARELP